MVWIAETGAEAAGAHVTHLDLCDYLLPLFDQDEEAASGKPDQAKALKQLMTQHDALLVLRSLEEHD